MVTLVLGSERQLLGEDAAPYRPWYSEIPETGRRAVYGGDHTAMPDVRESLDNGCPPWGNMEVS